VVLVLKDLEDEREGKEREKKISKLKNETPQTD
jgi:hypothetical protein